METRALRAKLRLQTLRQINPFHLPLDSLPSELLTCIFNFACPPIDFSRRSLCESDDDEEIRSIPMSNKSNFFPKPRNKHDLRHRYMPLILSAVCNRWREVAFSSPGIWSTFALEVITWKLKSQVSLLRLYLENTGSSPFSLDLDIRLQRRAYLFRHRQEAAGVEWKGLQPLADIIFHEFPEKIHTLRVAGAPPGWMYFLSQQVFPKLKDLTFTWGEDLRYPTTTTIENGAFTIQPYEIRRIRGFRSRPVSGLPPLTILHLRNVNISIGTKILLSCPHLVEYHYYPYRYYTNQSPSPSEALRKPFTLPNLKRFGWLSPQYNDELNIAFLENIRLPNLEELQWSRLPFPGLEDTVFRFFSKLPKTLRSLAYYNHSHSRGRDQCRFLSHFPSVQSLVFNKCSASFMKNIFRHLSDGTSGIESTFFLPGLDTVIVRNYREGAQEGVGRALVTMVDKKRRSLGISHFTFEAEDCEVRWTGNAQIRRKRFVVRTEGMINSYFTSLDLTLF